MTRRLLWSTAWQPGRTIAFAALGTERAIGLVGAHKLQGLTGVTAGGGTWSVCNSSIHVTQAEDWHHGMMPIPWSGIGRGDWPLRELAPSPVHLLS